MMTILVYLTAFAVCGALILCTMYLRGAFCSTRGRNSHIGRACVMPLSDLPVPTVQLITRYARGRLIAGTNKYALVCRQWRAADSSQDAEPLQLYLNLRHMSETDITRAFDWMAVHGQQVETLVLQACKSRTLPLDLFSRAAPSLTNLTWLEAHQKHSLVLLTPVLEHLPQLQHLGAAVDLAEDVLGEEEHSKGVFLDQSGLSWDEVPDLQQLCPQLVELHLTINPEDGLQIDQRLVQLLPGRLQQLTLTSGWGKGARLVAGHVEHLTALQQLSLDGVEMQEEDASMVVGSLGALQEVRVFSPGSCRTEVLIQLAPKLTACWYDPEQQGLEVLPQLTHLTLLMLSWRGSNYGGRMPEGTAEALAALPGLRALELEGSMKGDSMGEVLQQVAGMSSLRSLRLNGNVEGREGARVLSEGLEQCTQLTALSLGVLIYDRYNMARRAPRHFVPVPEQLTGLRSLALPGELFDHDDGFWMVPLVHLTSLCLRVWPGPVRHAVVEGPVCGVQDWPAVWKQVGRAGSDAQQAEMYELLQRVNATGNTIAVFGGWGERLFTAPPQTSVPPTGRLPLQCLVLQPSICSQRRRGGQAMVAPSL